MAYGTKKDIEDMGSKISFVLGNKKFNTFKIDARRADKKFPLNSQKINETLGGRVIDEFKKKVNLKNPDLTVFVEVLETDKRMINILPGAIFLMASACAHFTIS